jgi:hypothetical protein
VELLNPYQAFYFFSISSFDDLIKDIQIFIYNSADTITKLKFLIRSGLGKLKRLIQIPLMIIHNDNMSKIFDYLKGIYNANLKQFENSIARVKHTYTNLKTWIDDSYIGALSHTIYSNGYLPIKLYTFDKISMLKTISIASAVGAFSFVLRIGSVSKEIFENIVNKINQKFYKIFSGEHSLIKFSNENENFLMININKNLITGKSYKFLLQEFIDEINQIAHNANSLKNNFIRKFKVFLSIEQKCEGGDRDSAGEIEMQKLNK